jgi:hypothetical protein
MTHEPMLRVDVGARACAQVKGACEVALAKNGAQVACEYEWETDRKLKDLGQPFQGGR